MATAAAPAPPSPAPKGAPTSGCCKRLCKLLCPHHIDEIQGDDKAKDKYDDYQSFLSTVMTIGTLLLGFILTGTLLNYNYQGNHSRAGFAFPFDMVSGAAALFAAVSVMLSLWVSVRASVIFRNNGPMKALRAMRNSTLGTGVAELSLYVSVIFFFISVVMYISWAQEGPSEMCKYRGRVKQCPMMEADLRETLGRLCDDDADFGTQVAVVILRECISEEWEVCAQVRHIGVQWMNKDKEAFRAWAAQWSVCDWYNNQTGKGPLFHNMTRVAPLVHRLASEFCRTEQLANIADKLCDAGKLSDELRAMKACASANTDALAAAQCTDDIVGLATTCNNVCDSSFDFMRGLRTLLVPGTCVLGFVMIVRAIKIGQQVFANWQYNVATTTRLWQCCCHEVGIIDTFSSDEEPSTRCLHAGASETSVPPGALAA